MRETPIMLPPATPTPHPSIGDEISHDYDVRDKPPGALLALSREILAELRRQGVIRSGNAPAGDYAETLVQRSVGGSLAPPSQRSWDIASEEHGQLQVKARVIAGQRRAGERQLSPFRSWDFDACIVVLFDDTFGVFRAAKLPVEILVAAARRSEHVRGNIVFATDELLDRGEDWTERLRSVVP